MLLIICAGIFMPNFAQYQVSAFAPTIMADMNLSTAQFAQIATAPLIPGVLFSVVAGILVDKFGARKMLTAAMILSTLGVVWRALGSGYVSMYCSMIAIGLCATFLSANSAKILGQWFAPEKVAITVGIYLAVSNGAMALGQGTAALFPSMNGAFMFSVVLAVIVAVIYIIFMRDKQDNTAPSNDKITAPKVSVLEGVKVCIKNKYVWFAAICLMLNISAFCSLSQFLPQALASRGIAPGSSNTIATALTIGGLLSCFITPSLFMRLGHNKLLMAIYSIIAAFGIAFAWKLTDNTVLLFILILITGFFGNGFSAIITSIPMRLEDVGLKYAGTAGGLISTIQLAGTVILPSYIIAPIAGANYGLMFILFAALDILLIGAIQLLPKLD